MEQVAEDFESSFESIDGDDAKYVSDGRRFWLKNGDGTWVDITEASFKRHLRGLGISSKAPEGATLSPLESIVENVEMNYRVKWAGALAGCRSGFRWMCGNYVLVTEDPRLIEPVEPPVDARGWDEADDFGDRRGWPVLGRVVENLLSCSKEGQRQLWVYFSYLRHTLDCLYEGHWDKAPTLCIAGEVKCGKSLLIDIHRELFGGKEGQPYDWMVGKENFNGELLEAVLLTIDDEVSDTNPKSRNALSDRLKKMAAGTMQRIRGMHKDGIALQPLWRPMVAVNDTPDKLMVLPPIEEDNFDKIILFKAFRHPMPMPAATSEERANFWRTLKSELPHFIWWLRNEFQIPEALLDRFGVKYYHHPDVVSSLRELSSEMQIWYYIERTIFHAPGVTRRDPRTGDELEDGHEWMGTVEELYTYLTDTRDENRPTLNMEEARGVPKPGWLGRRLSKLAAIYPGSVRQVRTPQKRYWHLFPPQYDSNGGQ